MIRVDEWMLVQVSAIKQGISELRGGLKKAEAEIQTARNLASASDGAALMEQFATMMAAFYESSSAAVKSTEV